MKSNSIIITRKDYQHLKKLTGNGNIPDNERGADNLRKLFIEIERAKKVAPEKVASDVVTMNTVIEFMDLDNNRSRQLKLVYPQQADIRKGYVSVLAPIGTALLGYRKGDIVEWEVPSGKKKFLIKEIIYQPEAHGEYQSLQSGNG
jgi:regulator of nucleoside diphosphate kinase